MLGRLLQTAVWGGCGALLALAQTGSGVHPRPVPNDYSVTQKTGTATYAASLLPAHEVKDLFAVDISKDYLVFEVACYPTPAATLSVHPDDFLIKTGSHGEFVHPSDAVTVASLIQQKNSPRPHPGGRDTEVYTSANIGYESGTDPYTGRRVHGVYTGGGVGVGTGPAGPPPPLPPGSTPQDRAILESQLSDKALPSGSFSAPVAGFVYFPKKEVKKKTNGAYDLEYLSDSSGRVELRVPAKGK
ncbi:MAG TPA: hypothetical protein VFB14_02155 [Bryobacteraceae bacterium]|nr:hypothetical protein [Bryobacteraceae bacterium]